MDISSFNLAGNLTRSRARKFNNFANKMAKAIGGGSRGLFVKVLILCLHFALPPSLFGVVNQNLLNDDAT